MVRLVKLKHWRQIVVDFLSLVTIAGIVLIGPLLTRGPWIPRQVTPHFDIAWCTILAHSLLPSWLSALATALAIVTIVVGRRMGAYLSDIGVAVLIMAGVLPAVGSLFEATALVQLLDRSLDDGNMTIYGLASELQSSFSAQLDMVSAGCLRSGTLLLVVGSLTPHSTFRNFAWPIWQDLIPIAVAALAFAFRFKLTPNINNIEWAAACALVLAILMLRTVAPNAPSCATTWIACGFALAFLESAARNDVLSQLINPIRTVKWPHGWIADAANGATWRGLMSPSAYTAKIFISKCFAIGAPVLLMTSAIAWSKLHTVRFQWLPRSAWMVGVSVLLLPLLVVSSGPLHWTGAMTRLSALDTRLIELSQGKADSPEVSATGSHVPATLLGSAIGINRLGTMTQLTQNAESGHFYAPLLVVSPGLRLDQLFAALQRKLLDGHREYRWLTGEAGELEPCLAELSSLPSLIHSTFKIIEVELIPNLDMRAISETGDSTAPTTAVVIDGQSALTFPIFRSNKGDRIDYLQFRLNDLNSLKADSSRVNGSTLTLIWNEEAPIDSVVSAMRLLAQNGFRKFVITKDRREVEAVMADQLVAHSRNAHSSSVDAAEAFRTIVHRNADVSVRDLEFIEGSLIVAKAEYFENGFVTAQSRGLELKVADTVHEFVVSIHPTDARVAHAWGLAIKRRLGLVRKAWQTIGDQQVRVLARQRAEEYLVPAPCHLHDIRTNLVDEPIVARLLGIFGQSVAMTIFSAEGSMSVILTSSNMTMLKRKIDVERSTSSTSPGFYVDGTIDSADVWSVHGLPHRIPGCILQNLRIAQPVVTPSEKEFSMPPTGVDF